MLIVAALRSRGIGVVGPSAPALLNTSYIKSEGAYMSAMEKRACKTMRRAQSPRGRRGFSPVPGRVVRDALSRGIISPGYFVHDAVVKNCTNRLY